MNRKIILVILIQLIQIITFVSAAEPAGFSEEFHKPLDLWINGDMTSDVLFEEMNRLDSRIEQEVSGWENLYWRSRTAMIRGQIHYENKEKKDSIVELERCQELMHESLEMRNYSDSWRVLAESSSLIMIQKDLAYIIKNFSKSQEQAGTALELDPQNARASLVVAQFLSAAPGIAGGDKKEGLELLKDLSKRHNLIKEDRFYILTSLSEALKKSRKKEEAISACKQALALFPGNRNAQNLLADLQE